MATVHKFTRKAERISREKAERLRQMVLDFGLPDQAAEDVMMAIARHETGGITPAWKFNMLEPRQCLAVWEAIREMDRPELTRRIFDFCLTHIEPNSGAVTLTREELAERVQASPENVSRCMSQLERHNVIFRRRLKVQGMKGRGPVRYYLNPHVAWNGKLEVRAEQARQAPLPFEVVEGGKDAG